MAEQFYDSRTSPARWRALDPSTARTGLAHSTLYVPDRLLVAGDDRDAGLAAISEVASAFGWRLEWDPTFGDRDTPGTYRRAFADLDG